MKIHLKLLTERYWFRLGLSLCFAITAALSYADRDFIWMGLSLCLLLFSIWWQLSLYRIHTKRVLFMIDALENNDSAIHFPEEQIMPETREVNRALNRVGRILYNVKSETVQQEKYYELIMDCVNTGVLVLNENGAVYQKNNEALRLLGLNVFTHIRQLNKVDIQLMKKIEFCRPGDKIQTIFNNERGTINLSIRVSGITVREEQLRILAFNDINSELDEKEIPVPMTYEEGFAKVSKEYGCLERIMTYVDINTESYLSRLKNKSVRKNCSIPVWMDDEVKKYGINCSKVLQNALAMKIAEEREKDNIGDNDNENKKS